MTRVLDQQLVIHCYAPATGEPEDAGSYQAIREIWQFCRLTFGMTERVPGVGLPDLLPVSAGRFPADGEVPLAVQESPNGDRQAVLRRHHDLLNLSVALVGDPPHEGWWRLFGDQWSRLTGQYSAHLLGEMWLYLAGLDEALEPDGARPELGRLLGSNPERWSRSVRLPEGALLWELALEPEDRALRRFVLAYGPDGDSAASVLAWSDGRPDIPPLARYLLHAAKIRYELRVLRRDGQTPRSPAPEAPGEQSHRMRMQAVDLRQMRLTVQQAADNLERALRPDYPSLLVPGGPFADDADLVEGLLEELDDRIDHVGFAAERAGLKVERAPASEARAPNPAADWSANIFVVSGRDEPARLAIFAFLQSLGLRPMEWEHLVDRGDRAAPALSETVIREIPQAGAVLVLLTPEDTVRLHPDLCAPDDQEAHAALQARPNVLIELGVALAVQPTRTLIVTIGRQRLPSDIGGLNYVPIDGTPSWRRKIATRLRAAGCPVDDSGLDWLTAGDLDALQARHRKPLP